MSQLRAVLPEAIAEAASGRWREPVAALLDEQAHARGRWTWPRPCGAGL